MIIGITGTLAAGKGTIVEYLKKKGFKHFSVYDYIAHEVEKRGLEVNRDSLAHVANDLREKFGSSYIIEEIYRIAKRSPNHVIIESLRTPAEVLALKEKDDFYLFSIDAAPFLRYERAKKRGSNKDNVSYAEFLSNESREMQNKNPSMQNIKSCIDLADFNFTNEGTEKDLHGAIERVLQKIDLKEVETEKRPSWDEYFLEIVNTIKKRSTCAEEKSGCLVVKDKQILVAGYTGSPPGLSHCEEAGHKMKRTISEEGIASERCIRTNHSEQNAICQAAKKGVSLNGATFYCIETPCSVCTKMIITSGIKRIVCEKVSLQAKDSEEMLEQANVELNYLNTVF